MSDPRLFAQRYQLLDKIGEGQMGIVYKAHDTHTNSILALKTLKFQRDDPARTITRFKREFQAISNLQHPHCIQVYEL